MRKITQTVKSNKKDTLNKNKVISKPLNKNKNNPNAGKHRTVISAITQRNGDKMKYTLQNSFCNTHRATKDKKNTVLFNHINHKKEDQSNTFNRTIIKDKSDYELHNSKTEIGEELNIDDNNDSKIDLLQNKINFLYEVIEDFETNFLKENKENKIKEELKTMRKYSLVGDSVCCFPSFNKHKTEVKKLNSSGFHSKIKNKSVDFASKTTMESSIINPKKINDKTEIKDKESKGGISSYRKKIEPKTLYTPNKNQLSQTVHYMQKKDFTVKKKLKNNSLCNSERMDYKKNIKFNAHKRIVSKYSDKNIKNNKKIPAKENQTVKMFFVDTVDEEDKCKTERAKLKPDIFK